MARPKEPIDLIVAKGNKANLTKEEIKQRKNEEVRAAKDQIKAPLYLQVEEIKRFNYYVQQLTAANIITNLDVHTLARHVMAELKFEETAAELRVAATADPQYKNLSTMYDKLLRDCNATAAALGLNIMARSKLIVKNQAPEIKENKFNKFMG